MYRATILDQSLQPTTSMRASRNGHTASVFEIAQGLYSSRFVFFTPRGGGGGMGKEATTFYKRLANNVFLKIEETLLCWHMMVEEKLSFAAVHMAIMCIRGTRSSNNRPLQEADITLAASAEGGIPQELDCLFVCVCVLFVCLCVCLFYWGGKKGGGGGG